MFYVLDDDNKIAIADNSFERLQATIDMMPALQGHDILETEKEIVNYKGKYYFADDAEYIAQKEADEAERIQNLYMTRSDFFDGTIKAFMATEDILTNVIQNVLDTMSVNIITKLIAMNNFKNALNFYRKHTLFTLLSGVELHIGDNTVVITSEQWDKFFDETSKKNPDAYKELLPTNIV